MIGVLMVGLIQRGLNPLGFGLNRDGISNRHATESGDVVASVPIFPIRVVGNDAAAWQQSGCGESVFIDFD